MIAIGNQAERQQLLNRIQELQDAPNVGAYVFTKDINGRYTFVNRMVCELFNRRLIKSSARRMKRS